MMQKINPEKDNDRISIRYTEFLAATLDAK
jgi:hypothetical protein